MSLQIALIAGGCTILAALLTGVFGLLLAKMLRPNELIDQLQEERGEVRRRLTGLELRERIRDDYIQTLRQHITDGLPPPPPAWPAGLTQGLL